MKWLATIFLALAFAVLSFNAFIGNDLSRSKSSNRFVSMLVDGYTWLIGAIGATPTAVVFALCAVGIVLAAVMDGRSKTKVI